MDPQGKIEQFILCMKLHNFLKQRGLSDFESCYGGTRKCAIKVRIRNCFQCWGLEKLGAQVPLPRADN